MNAYITHSDHLIDRGAWWGFGDLPMASQYSSQPITGLGVCLSYNIIVYQAYDLAETLARRGVAMKKLKHPMAVQPSSSVQTRL